LGQHILNCGGIGEIRGGVDAESGELRIGITRGIAGAVDDGARLPCDTQLQFLAGLKERADAGVPAEAVGVQVEHGFQSRKLRLSLKNVGSFQGVGVIDGADRGAKGKPRIDAVA